MLTLGRFPSLQEQSSLPCKNRKLWEPEKFIHIWVCSNLIGFSGTLKRLYKRPLLLDNCKSTGLATLEVEQLHRVRVSCHQRFLHFLFLFLLMFVSLFQWITVSLFQWITVSRCIFAETICFVSHYYELRIIYSEHICSKLKTRVFVTSGRLIRILQHTSHDKSYRMRTGH